MACGVPLSGSETVYFDISKDDLSEFSDRRVGLFSPCKKREFQACSNVEAECFSPCQPSKKRVLSDVTNAIVEQESSRESAKKITIVYEKINIKMKVHAEDDSEGDETSSQVTHQNLSDAKQDQEEDSVKKKEEISKDSSVETFNETKKEDSEYSSKEKSEDSGTNSVNSEKVKNKEVKSTESSEQGDNSSSNKKDTEESGSGLRNKDKEHESRQCAMYVQDIYNNYKIKELKNRPIPNYIITVQHDIDAEMRAILVDWLVEVAEEYSLLPDTLYLGVALMDRYLSLKPMGRHHLQLVGVACLMIASKYEEHLPPELLQFCDITDNSYTKEQMKIMETKVLTLLDFELSIPTAKTFLRRFIRISQVPQRIPSFHVEILANYLTELTLIKCRFLKYLPSMIAASAVFLARLTFDCTKYPWNSTLEHHTGYKPSQLKECVIALNNLQRKQKDTSLTAIRNKYSAPKYKNVARLCSPTLTSEKLFQDIAYDEQKMENCYLC